ncbi:hypothetical protein NDU88_001992 [Pleurodeles waltl]|uniref:ABC transmembrane type-1 domain-containing protein n=1 Tax=Pleurodeles waltl TaxID=8319 RepID=A0AAV7V9Z3_PLEWA|nr:hypothetical protein NDU88_001992 [Pleurodeles waltl]
MAAMSAVVPLAQDVTGPLAVLAAVSVVAVLAAASVALVLAVVSVVAVLAADSVASVVAVGSVALVLAAGSVALVLVAVSVAPVLAADSVASVLAAVIVAVVLAAVIVAAVLVAGSVTVVLVAVLLAVQVAVLVAVLSTVQVCVDMDLPFTFWPFPTLDGDAAVLSLSTFVLPEPLVAGVFAFSLWDVGNFFTFGGGGMSLPSLCGTLAALLLAHSKSPQLLALLCPVMWWLRCWVGTWKGGP